MATRGCPRGTEILTEIAIFRLGEQLWTQVHHLDSVLVLEHGQEIGIDPLPSTTEIHQISRRGQDEDEGALAIALRLSGKIDQDISGHLERLGGMARIV